MSTESQPLRAFYWMMGAVVSFAAMAVAGREISAEMNTFELMLYRSVIGFAIIVVIILRSNAGFSQIKTSRIDQHTIRNVVHFISQNMWFYGIATIELSQMVALEFTNPIWVALLAPFLLGEKMTRTKILVAVLGFIGVMVAARPGSQPLEWGHAAGLGAAIGFAINTIMTRKIMRVDTVLCVLFWMTLMQAVFALALALPGGIPWPSTQLWPWLIVVSIGGLTAHYCLTSALGLAPASVVAPMDFVRLPIVAILGMLLYAEPILWSIFIGGGIIIAANILNLRSKP
ncbi:MAG: DMT family transporter [Rhodobacteraceae bacterium]|nr:DMT family transporter [Paracoccaceae bacterium]